MRPGDIVWIDFGIPAAGEPGFERPAVVVGAPEFLEVTLKTVNLVPLSTTVRGWLAEVPVDGWGAAQCWLATAPSRLRITRAEAANVGQIGRAHV